MGQGGGGGGGKEEEEEEEEEEGLSSVVGCRLEVTRSGGDGLFAAPVNRQRHNLWCLKPDDEEKRNEKEKKRARMQSCRGCRKKLPACRV